MENNMSKQPKCPFKDAIVGTESEIVSNPFTGQSCELTPDAVATYDVLKGAEQLGMHKIVRQGLDWFIENYTKEYMILLD